MPSDPARRRRAGLQFQAEAARVQFASARLLRDTTAEFVHFYRASRWPGDGETARAGLSESRELNAAWDSLAPPEHLRSPWGEVSQHLRALSRLYEELLALQRRPGGPENGPVLALQAAFNLRLHWMLQSETRLL